MSVADESAVVRAATFSSASVATSDVVTTYGAKHTFPRKLYILLDTTPKEIVTWLSDGRSFRIIDEAVFCQNVLPKYFAHNKMASFQRQLNIYGFRRLIKVHWG